MKSKILFSLFTLIIFCSGLGIGAYFGVAAGSTPSVGQLWAGAKEMQAIVESINNENYHKAKQLACMSIETRVTIMDFANPFGSKVIDSQTREVEESIFSEATKNTTELSNVCL